MSDIIDLDFYRKFRVVLPIHQPKDKALNDKTATTKVYHRRRKANPKISSKSKNTTPR